MKSIVCESPFQMRLVERTRPAVQDGHALVRIRRIGVCGTDLHAYQGNQPFFSYPRVLGHELAGQIESVGDNAYGLTSGQHVVVLPYLACGRCIACRRDRPNCCAAIQVMGVHTDGGMCEFLNVPVDAVVAADGLDWDRMALVECLAIGAHAVRRAAIEPGENAVVIGCGPIGIGIMQFARAAGARVIGVDTREARLEFWKRELGGADAVIADGGAVQRIGELTDGEQATVVFDATGSAACMSNAFDYVAHGGRLVYVGLTKENLSFPHTEMHKREATLLASRNATRADFENVIASLADGSVKSGCMVTHRVGFDDIVASFDEWIRPEAGVIKALVEL